MEERKKKKRLIFFTILILIIILLVTGITLYILNNKDKEDNKEKENKSKTKEEFSYTPPLYKICDEDSCVHVMGTIHLGNSKVNKLSKQAIDIYENSNILAVEIDTNEEDLDITSYIAEEGKSINDLASEELKNSMLEFSQKHPLFNYDTLKYYTPGFIASYLSSLLYMESGYIQDGVDSYLLDKAHKDNKTIIALETMEEQEELMFGYSDEFYLNEIEDVINQFDLGKIAVKLLFESYINEDIKGLKDSISSDIDEENNSEEYQKYIYDMYTARNIKMTNRVKEFLANNQDVLVAVGAAHVISDDGIVNQLSNGYKVERIK